MDLKEILGEELWEISQGLLGALFFICAVGLLAYWLVYHASAFN